MPNEKVGKLNVREKLKNKKKIEIIMSVSSFPAVAIEHAIQPYKFILFICWSITVK